MLWIYVYIYIHSICILHIYIYYIYILYYINILCKCMFHDAYRCVAWILDPHFCHLQGTRSMACLTNLEMRRGSSKLESAGVVSGGRRAHILKLIGSSRKTEVGSLSNVWSNDCQAAGRRGAKSGEWRASQVATRCPHLILRCPRAPVSFATLMD